MEETLFNKEVALERAMYIFWERGYEQTSIKDLLQAMEILNGSFYNTFGSKQKIFLNAIDLYAEKILKDRIEKFRKKRSFRSGLKAFFDLHLLDFQDKKNPKGCMIINSIQLELLKDAKINQCVRSKIGILQKFIKEEIEEAYKNKELKKGVTPEVLSCLIVTFIQGISKSAGLGESTTTLNQQIDAFIGML